MQCHKGGKQVSTLKESIHASTGCTRCHQPTGVTGGMRQAVGYGRMLYVYSKTRAVPEATGHERVENGSCLRCHDAIRRGVTQSGTIRVRHSDFLDEGAKCVDCHGVSMHPYVATTASKPTMDKCTRCHDGKKASRECSVCHAKDIALSGDIARYGKVRIAGDERSCYRCHQQRTCNRCHGVTMPHPGELDADTADERRPARACARRVREAGRLLPVPLRAGSAACRQRGQLFVPRVVRDDARRRPMGEGAWASGDRAEAGHQRPVLRLPQLRLLRRVPSGVLHRSATTRSRAYDNYARDIPVNPMQRGLVRRPW